MFCHNTWVRRPQRGLAAAVTLAALSGCPQCTPEQVGEDVARLTVRNLYGMVVLLEEDDSCGFANPAVIAAGLVEGAAGTEGSVTYRIEDCEIDLGNGRAIVEDCDGTTHRGSGRITVDATRTVIGTVTGNPDNPVIPTTPDAVTLNITEARLDDFEVTRSDDEDSLRMRDGTLSAAATIRLAASSTSGLCTVPTPNIALREIRYDDARVRVIEEDREYNADILESDVRAQFGRGGNEENTIDGTMTVYGADVDISGNNVLFDDYDREQFVASYDCRDDITSPVSFECTEVGLTSTDTAARLGLSAFSAIAILLESDSACGFSTPSVISNAEVVGTAGSEGTVTLTVENCPLTFITPRTLPADCSGASQTVSGSVLASGTKTIRGLLTGDPASPILPLSSQPVTYTLELSFDELLFGSTANDDTLLFDLGTARGNVRPVFYVGEATGACSVMTPNVDLDGVVLDDASVVVTNAVGAFNLDINAATLSGTIGVTDAGMNLINGSMTVDGEAVEVDTDNRGYDPAFTEAAFLASWQCNAALAEPLSSECRDAGLDTLSVDVAGGTIRTLGIAVQAMEENSVCGFSSTSVLQGATVVEDPTGRATATFELPSNGCTITAPTAVALFVDCLGDMTSMTGTLTARGRKIVVGAPTTDPSTPIVPLQTDAVRYEVEFTFDEVSFEKAGNLVGLDVNAGTLSASVTPRLAFTPETQACTFITPIAQFDEVTWGLADVVLPSLSSDASGTASAVTTALRIEESQLEAQAGSGILEQNTLRGSVRFLGSTVLVDGPLDTEFDPITFAATWNCAANGSPQLVDDAQCALADTL